MPPCKYKHDYKLYNNRYKNGKPVIKGGEWVTEWVCSKCEARPPQDLLKK